MGDAIPAATPPNESGRACSCWRTRAGKIEVIPFGADLVLRPLLQRGGPLWWLGAAVCDDCGQHWLIAQEERINDLYLLKQMTAGETQAVVRDAVWPTTFDRYESLLQIGEAAGHSWRKWAGSATAAVATAHVLRQERPDMTVDEIVTILRLDRDEARQVEEDFAGVYGRPGDGPPC